jgi:hypothetical protein
MRCQLLVLVLAAATPATPATLETRPSSDKYTTRYDHIDVDGILKSERLLRNYFNCLVDKGPCTREGLELKSEFHMCPYVTGLVYGSLPTDIPQPVGRGTFTASRVYIYHRGSENPVM